MHADAHEVVAASTSRAVDLDPARRIARAVAAAGVATLVALLFHLLAGGATPHLLGVAVPLLLATAVCLVLAQVRLPWLRLALSVGVSQLFFHLLFSIGAPGAVPAAGPVTSHQHGAAAVVLDGAGPATHAGHGGAAMWVAHVIAALVTVLALRHGEATLHRLARALRRAGERLA
ncbi:hypothetical protein, partial [Cellulomonas triticagri]